MSPKPQYINDEDGKRQFVVLPISDYLGLIDASKHASAESVKPSSLSLVSADRTKVRLPNGGPGAYIDLVRLADYFQRRGTDDLGISQEDMAVNQRAQSLEKFPENQRDTLDPFVRRHFLSPDSPYKNTMQVTTEVVDALVETGLFERTKRKYPYSYRPVNALKIVVPALLEYLKEKGPAPNPIRLYS